MCGIFAYVNCNVQRKKSEIIDILINGIKRMEYRGYDSAGICFDGDRMESDLIESKLIKSVGKVDELKKTITAKKLDIDYEKLFDKHCGIAHTRWATHGVPSEINAHPQPSDSKNQFLVVHNGIITNHKEIREFLKSHNYITVSDTDTEVISLLLLCFFDLYLNKNGKKIDFLDLVKSVLHKLEGAYAIAVKSNHYLNECIAARRGSPMIVGIKTQHSLSKPVLERKETCDSPIKKQRKTFVDVNSINNSSGELQVEYFIASDACSIIERTKDVIYIEEGDVIHINKNGEIKIQNLDVDSDTLLNRQTDILDIEVGQIMKGNYNSFMEKEIFEQPESLVNTMRGRVNFEKNFIVLGGLSSHMKTLTRSRRILFIACGTSYHSAIAVRKLFGEMTELPIIVEIASDFLDRQVSIFRDDVCIFISQSGETADTLNALRYCKANNALLIGITNVVGSSVSRETDCGIHLNAGPEIGVASTKAYTSQIVALTLMACWMGRDSRFRESRINQILLSLKNISSVVTSTLKCYDQIKLVAEKLKDIKTLTIIGRGYQVATCFEGSLKIKEISYIHTEGMMAGELKHGTIALADKNMNCIFIISKDFLYDKSMNALEQILSRNCRPIVVCDEACDIDSNKVEFVIKVPQVIDTCQAIPFIIPFQLLALQLATLRGHNVDFPRNLAKSVTVE